MFYILVLFVVLKHGKIGAQFRILIAKAKAINQYAQFGILNREHVHFLHECSKDNWVAKQFFKLKNFGLKLNTNMLADFFD